MPSSSAFVHRTITLNIGAGGGELERGGLQLNRICRSPKVCVSLSCVPGCVALQTLPFSAADPGLPRGCGRSSMELGADWGHGAKHVEEGGGNHRETREDR